LESVRKIQHKDKVVLIVDYSGRRGMGMIEIFDRAKSLILEENKHFVILNIFNSKTFVSPDFMRHIQQNLSEVERLIDKQAIIGLSAIQVWILKGMNLWYSTKIYEFNSQDDALDFLTMGP
jgi:hypothetical protein